MSQLERHIVYLPAAKIKNEYVPELEEDTVHCRLCPKGFVSVMALNNHAKIQHIDAYVTGDPSLWTAVKEEPEEAANTESEDNKDQLVFEIEPNNISYVIVGAEDEQTKKKKHVKKTNTSEKVKKKKEPEPITGPFECLQPSSTVPEATCHQIFFSCCEYSIHHRDEHAKRRKGFRCQVCEKPLACAGEEAAPFPCEICGVGFQTSDQLSSHTAINHVKLKPYECNICHKRFTQQGGVVQHMRMHTGDRPFPCTFCTKSFTQKSGLDQHLRTHTKVKPYCCIVCKKSFCQSVHLRQHMRTHTKVAPFQCGICQKKFKQRSHLSFHLKSHLPTMSEDDKAKYKDIISGLNTPNDITQGISLVDDSQIEETQCSQNLAEMDLLTMQEDVQLESVVMEESCYAVEGI